MGNACSGADYHDIALDAVKRGDDKALLAALSAKGSNRVRVNERDREHDGTTMLCTAAAGGFNKIINILLERGAAVDTATDNGMTPLILALKNGREGSSSILLNAGADVDKSDSASGKSALLWAVEMKVSATIVKQICDKGCDTEAKSRLGLTALMMAADANNADVTRVLLQAGANPRYSDQRVGSALSRAKEKKNTMVVSLLEAAINSKGGSPDKAPSTSLFGPAKSSSSLLAPGPTSGSAGRGRGSSSSGLAGSSTGASSRAASSAASASPRAGRSDSLDREVAHDRSLTGKRRSSGNIMAGKQALGAGMFDLAAGGAAMNAVSASKERTKDIKYKSVSLDAGLAGR
jgi:hypothetical protein